VGFDEKMGAGNHYRHEKVEEAVVSRVKGKGDVALTAKNLRAEGAQLESDAKLMAIAENDLVLNGAKESRDFEEFHKTKSGSLARTTKTSLDQQHSVTQVGTQVSGKAVLLSAVHDVKAKGIQAIADDNLHIQAGHDVDIAADTNHFKNKHVETKKTNGVFTGSGIGVTVGSKSEKHDYETEGWTQSDARSTLGSMNGNIRVSAGNHTNVLGTDMMTPRTNRIDIKGASVKVEAGKDIIERKEGHEYKQSGVTIALSTPVTDMAQAAYSSAQRSQQVTNPKLKALYAMKAGEEAVMAAQNVGKVAETLDALRAGNMQNTGTTSSPSMKVSIGYGSQKQTQSSESQSISHQKSMVSTGTFNVKARDEKLTFEGVDANAKLMALSGKKGIEIKGVKDEEHQRTENKSVGGSVGVFVGTNGNSYGIGIEGSVNAAKGKSNSDSERWQNSHFTADKIITNSEEGGLTLDAANLKAKRWEANIQNLTITSRQDTEKYESKQTSASASGSVAQGAGGGASVSASYNKAKVDYAQVNEQAGIRVGEDGMDAHIHNHTQLNGAIVESDADASKNRFKTKSLTHTDIENKSEIKTESASMSAGSGGVNPMQALSSALSLLGNTNESARSTTQSAISSNIQIDTETPENLTALSRDTKNANQRVEKQDLQKVQERQEMAKVIGDISNNAISIATYNEREKINKLGLEKFKLEEQEKALKGQAGNEQQLAAIKQQLTNVQAEITKTQGEIDRTYGIGSEKGMAIRAVTAALQAAAQNDTAGSLVALASPYLNKTIHEMTAGDTAKDKAANLMAHALLSAVEFQVTGKDPLTGAMAGVTGEVTAQILTQAIYNKTPNQLTANEKENISTLSQLAGGLAAALTAKANGTTAEQGGNFLAASSGAETAKRAVENNYLKPSDLVEAERKYKACKGDSDCEMRVVEETNELSKKRNQELDEYRQSLERELLAAKRSAEQQCAGNADCYLAYSQEANKHFKEQLNAYLAHVSEGKDFESLVRNYYPDDAYFRSIWYGLTNSGPQKTKESLKSAKDYIDNTSLGEALDDTLRIGKKLVRLPKEWIEQDIPAHSVEKALREMTDGNPQDVGEVFFGLTTSAATVSVAGKTMKWIGGKWVRSPDVDYSRDNANLGVNNKGFNISLNENISVKPAGTISNIDSVNKLIKGELPGVSTNNRVGVPREMAPTSTPNETARDFIKRYTESLGEELPKPIITGKNKDLEKYELNNGTVIMLRTSGTASSKTSPSTATVDINNPELRHQNGGIQLKLKFPLKSEVK